MAFPPPFENEKVAPGDVRHPDAFVRAQIPRQIPRMHRDPAPARYCGAATSRRLDWPNGFSFNELSVSGPRRSAMSTPSRTRSMRSSLRLRSTAMSGYKSWNAKIRRLTCRTPSAAVQEMRIVPAGAPRVLRASSPARSTSRRICTHCAWNRLPSSVTVTRRVVRLSSGTPTAVSSSRRWRVTVDWPTPSSRATADRLPRSATRTKVRIRSSVTSNLSAFRHNHIHSHHIPDRRSP